MMQGENGLFQVVLCHVCTMTHTYAHGQIMQLRQFEAWQEQDLSVMLLEMLIAPLSVSLHFPSLRLCVYLPHMQTQSPLFLLVFGTQGFFTI